MEASVELQAAILADVGQRPGAMMSEAELLKKLAQAPMSEADVRPWIRLSGAPALRIR